MIERSFSNVFWLNYNACLKHPRYISNRGGTRSGKTYSLLQLLHMLIPKADKAGDISSVVSETMPHLKRGAMRDFERILGVPLKDNPNWNATDFVYTYPNGAKLEFFSADTPSKVLGPARKRLLANECNHIPWEIFRQLAVRTTSIIFMDYNPASPFWATERIEPKDNCITLVTTYKDNEFLSPQQVEEIESNRNDENWWRVYGLGQIGRLEGAIYEFEQIDELPNDPDLADFRGMDFGFTNDPTAIVHIKADTGKKVLYVDEECYQTRMLNADIIDTMKAHNVPLHSLPIYADCAEPKSIAEICNAGYNVIPCKKQKTIVEQINFVKGYKLCVTKRSINLIKELRNYVWAKDKDGKDLNQPIDKWNHCFVGDTQIKTIDGEKSIKDIREGDIVLTMEGWKVVEKRFDNGLREVLHLSINFGNFVVEMEGTPDHEIKTERGWIQLQDLKAGDVIFLCKSSMVKNTTSTTEKGLAPIAVQNSPLTNTARQPVVHKVVVQSIGGYCVGKKQVYDLRVNGCHEYFANGILVHNCLDAMRYGIWTHLAEKAGAGKYNITFDI